MGRCFCRTGSAIFVALGLSSYALASELVAERQYRDFTVRITGDQDVLSAGRLEILRKGQRVYSLSSTGGSFAFVHQPPIGANVLGSGEPILAIDEYSGGAHCCHDTLLFGLGAGFRVAGKLPGGDAPGEFGLSGGKWLYQHYDGTFRYWKAAFAYSPQCRVTLAFADGRWKLLPDQMRRRPFGQAAVARLALTISSDGWDETQKPELGRYNPELWEYMLDMIYSGNPQAAFRLFDLAWPKRLAAEKEQFRRDFLAQLHLSPYSQEISKVGNVPLSATTPGERDHPLCAGP